MMNIISKYHSIIHKSVECHKWISERANQTHCWLNAGHGKFSIVNSKFIDRVLQTIFTDLLAISLEGSTTETSSFLLTARSFSTYILLLLRISEPLWILAIPDYVDWIIVDVVFWFCNTFTSKSLRINKLAIFSSILNCIIGTGITLCSSTCTAFQTTFTSSWKSRSILRMFILFTLWDSTTSLNELVSWTLLTITGWLLVNDHSLELRFDDRLLETLWTLRPDSPLIHAIFGCCLCLTERDVTLSCFFLIINWHFQALWWVFHLHLSCYKYKYMMYRLN